MYKIYFKENIVNGISINTYYNMDDTYICKSLIVFDVGSGKTTGTLFHYDSQTKLLVEQEAIIEQMSYQKCLAYSQDKGLSTDCMDEGLSIFFFFFFKL